MHVFVNLGTVNVWKSPACNSMCLCRQTNSSSRILLDRTEKPLNHRAEFRCSESNSHRFTSSMRDSRDGIDQTDKDVYSALIGGLPFFMHVNVTSFNFPVKGVVRKKNH